MKREAFAHWNAGTCVVIDYWKRHTIARSSSFRRATRKARNLGYDVTVYCTYKSDAPRDAVNACDGSYVLPRVS